MTAEEILARGADTVERGWRQDGKVLHDDPRRCAITACSEHAVPLTPPILKERNRAITAIAREIGGWHGPSEMSRIITHIANWNDARGRTAEEVATTMRNAKRQLEAL